MDLVTEAANRVWLQQLAEPLDLKTHLGISHNMAERLLQRLAELGVVQTAADGNWLAMAMPQHFFQKKGHSLYRRLTIYLRPKAGSTVVGVIEPYHTFLTHQQNSDWWLVCNNQGSIGYISVEALRFIRMD